MLDGWIVTFALLLIALTIFYRYVREKQRFFEVNGVPHVKPTFLVGNHGGIFTRKFSVGEHARNVYNGTPADVRYMGYYNLLQPAFMIKDLDLIKELANKHFDNFMDHTKFVVDDLEPLFSNSLLSLSGDVWRERRAILSPSFTGSKLKGMFNLINQCALNFNDHMSQLVNEPGPVDVKDLCARFTNDVIASAAFGLSVNSLMERDNVFYKTGREAISFDFVKTMKMFLVTASPKIARFLRVRLVPKAMQDYFSDIIESTVEVRQKEGIVRPDMIQLMIQARNESKLTNNGVAKLSLEDMTAQAFVFFLAGLDTTSTTIGFAAHELAHHPEVQEKLAREVNERISDIIDEKTGYEALKDFHYLDAVVNETLRLYPPNHLTDRVCNKRFELPPAVAGGKPVFVEPGWPLWFPIFPIHRDPRYYEEPDEFKPERFLDEEGKLKVRITDSPAFMPFGIGPRMCIASRFAMLEVKLAIIHLVAKCKLLPSDKSPHPIKLGIGHFLTVPANGFWLNLEKR